MKTDNSFRNQVDNALQSVQWTPWKSAAVFQQLHEEKKPVRRHLRALALAMTLLLVMSMSALAVGLLNRAPEADAVTQARRALMDKYGLTYETLGIFHDTYTQTDDGWRVTFEYSMGLSTNRIGVYTVEKNGDVLTASWTHDGVDPAEWQDGDLLAPVWGQPQLVKAVGAEREEAYRISVGEQVGPVETPIPAEFAGASVWNHTTREVAPIEGDISVEEAINIAQAALQDEFSLTAEQAAAPFHTDDYIHHAGQLVVDGNGTRMWEFAFYMVHNGIEYNGAVFINSQTGAIEAIKYTTLGNG